MPTVSMMTSNVEKILRMMLLIGKITPLPNRR
jgi:hypothetical protein